MEYRPRTLLQPVSANCFGFLSSLNTPHGINLETNGGSGLHRYSLQVAWRSSECARCISFLKKKIKRKKNAQYADFFLVSLVPQHQIKAFFFFYFAFVVFTYCSNSSAVQRRQNVLKSTSCLGPKVPSCVIRFGADTRANSLANSTSKWIFV